MKSNQTNWYVITGGPSTGKTTLINMLNEKGYNTTIEHARHYIDTMIDKGKTVEEIRENKKEFQLGVLKMQIEQEASIDKNEIYFLDRAIPDALAYYQFLNIDVNSVLNQAIKNSSYKKIFILDKLPLIKDYARIENKNDQTVIHDLITKVYESLPFPVINVPVLSPKERMEFIINNL
jgi:predicted ATPase